MGIILLFQCMYTLLIADMQVSCGPEGVAYKMCKLVSRRTLPYLIVVICFAPLCSPPSRIHAHLRYCARFLSTFHFSYTPPSPTALPLTLFILFFFSPSLSLPRFSCISLKKYTATTTTSTKKRGALFSHLDNILRCRNFLYVSPTSLQPLTFPSHHRDCW